MADSKLKKIQFKRLLTKYESSLEDLEYLREMASEINSDFSSALAAKKRPDLFESKKVEQMAEDDEESVEKESAARDPLFKKLFRKIVVQCHPDRMDEDLPLKQKAERLEFYDLANKANDEDNMALLIVVAIKLEIELSEEYIEHVEKIEEENKKIEKEIENIQSSVAWTWYHAEEDKRDSILNSYIKHMESVLLGPKKEEKTVKILGLGHPRTGTGFTAHLLKSWGLDVGHEVLGEDGIVAWQLAVTPGPWLYMPADFKQVKPELVIYNVRDPKTAIASIVHTENTKEESLNFRLRKGRVINSKNPIELAINSILRWDFLINRHGPDFVYRIEDQEKDLFDFLKSMGYNINYVPSTGKINSRDHDGLESLESEKRSVSPSLQKKLNDYCIKYGYEPYF